MGIFGLSSEAQILLAAAAFYLYDAATVLPYGEGLLIGRAGKWRVLFATDGQYLARRFLLWPPLGVLHARVYRLQWSSSHVSLAAVQPADAWVKSDQGFRVLAALAYAQAWVLAVLLPIALFVLHSEAVLLVLALTIYSIGMAQAVWVWRGARSWGLEKKAAYAIALEVLFCPPFGLNVIKKITLNLPCTDNLLAAAATMLSTESFQELRSRATQIIEDELLDHDDDSAAAIRLRQSIEVLTEVDT